MRKTLDALGLRKKNQKSNFNKTNSSLKNPNLKQSKILPKNLELLMDEIRPNFKKFGAMK